MANDHVGGKVVVLLELPDSGILRVLGLPSDPQFKKGNFEILTDIIQYGMAGVGWECDMTKSDIEEDILTLSYVGV